MKGSVLRPDVDLKVSKRWDPSREISRSERAIRNSSARVSVEIGGNGLDDIRSKLGYSLNEAGTLF